MTRYRVFERQVITYAWNADEETPEEAEATAWGGVPDDAITVRFSSENWVEVADGDGQSASTGR